MAQVAQTLAARSPAQLEPTTGTPDDGTWSAERWARWLGSAAVTLCVLGTISVLWLKPQSAGGQVSAFLSILALVVLLSAMGLRRLMGPGAQRFIDIVTLERGPAVALTVPEAGKPWGFWPSLFWVGLGSVITIATRNLWPDWFSWMAAGNHWAQRAPVNMLAWRLFQGLDEAVHVLLPLVIAVRLAGWSQADYFALVRPRAKWVLIGIACTLAWLLAENAIILGLSLLATGKAPWQADGSPILMMWCAFSFAVLYAPIIEELTYRGFLYRGLAESRLGANGAIVVTAFVFALQHAYQGRDGVSLLLVFGTGVLFGWLRKRSGSTLLPIVLHSLCNSASVLQQTLFNLGWLS